jgi:hypothetical protein
MSPNAGGWGGGGVAGSQPMSAAVHMEPPKNFGDLTPYLTYGVAEYLSCLSVVTGTLDSLTSPQDLFLYLIKNQNEKPVTNLLP